MLMTYCDELAHTLNMIDTNEIRSLIKTKYKGEYYYHCTTFLGNCVGFNGKVDRVNCSYVYHSLNETDYNDIRNQLKKENRLGEIITRVDNGR